MQYLLGPDEVLTRVTRHELLRGADRVRIDLHEVLQGAAGKRFVAIPVNRVQDWAAREFWGAGDLPEQALATCLDKIRERDEAELFPTDTSPDNPK